MTVATILELGGSGTIVSGRMGDSGVSDVPLRLHEEEALILGQPASEETFARIAERGAGSARRGDPVMAGIELRRRAARALLLCAHKERGARQAG